MLTLAETKRGDPKRVLSGYVEGRTYRAFQRIAKRNHRTMTSLATLVLEQYVEADRLARANGKAVAS